jgi:hypothetical protein
MQYRYIHLLPPPSRHFWDLIIGIHKVLPQIHILGTNLMNVLFEISDLHAQAP